LDVVNMKDLFQKILEIVAFAEACELGNIVKPDIHHAFDASVTELFEKLGGGFLGEPDGENRDGFGGHNHEVCGTGSVDSW